jgi:hypothetical protein
VDPDSSYTWGPLSWSPSGCHGVATLSQAVLRLINLPVDANWVDGTGHRAPYFWTIGETLSHGDDVYEMVSNWHPTWSASLLMISNAQYQDWFVGPNASGNNVGRRPHDVTLKLLPNELTPPRRGQQRPEDVRINARAGADRAAGSCRVGRSPIRGERRAP